MSERGWTNLFPALAVGNSVAIHPAWYGSIKDADPYESWVGTIVDRRGLEHVVVQWRNGPRTQEHMANLRNYNEGRDVRYRP